MPIQWEDEQPSGDEFTPDVIPKKKKKYSLDYKEPKTQPIAPPPVLNNRGIGQQLKDITLGAIDVTGFTEPVKQPPQQEFEQVPAFLRGPSKPFGVMAPTLTKTAEAVGLQTKKAFTTPIVNIDPSVEALQSEMDRIVNDPDVPEHIKTATKAGTLGSLFLLESVSPSSPKDVATMTGVGKVAGVGIGMIFKRYPKLAEWAARDIGDLGEYAWNYVRGNNKLAGRYFTPTGEFKTPVTESDALDIINNIQSNVPDSVKTAFSQMSKEEKATLLRNALKNRKQAPGVPTEAPVEPPMAEVPPVKGKVPQEPINATKSEIPPIIDTPPAELVVTPKDAPELVKTKIKTADSIANAEKPAGIFQVPVSSVNVVPEKYQYRAELDTEKVKNIVENFDPALFDPIKVRRSPDGSLELLAGHHRLAAVQKMGEPTIPAQVFDVDEPTAMQIAKKSNSMASAYNPVDEAKIFAIELKKGRSGKAVGDEFGGKSAYYVEDTAMLDKLAPGIKQNLRDGTIKLDLAKGLARAVDKYKLPAELQQEIFQSWILKQNITRTDLETAMKYLAPKMTEMVQQGLGFEVVRGMAEPVNEIFKAIKQGNLTARRFKGTIKAIQEIKKAGQPLTPELIMAETAINSEMKKYAQKVVDLTKSIGLYKPKLNKLSPAEVQENKIYWSDDTNGASPAVVMEGRAEMVSSKYPEYADKIEYFISSQPVGSKLKYLKWEMDIFASGKAMENEISDVVNLFDKYNSKLKKKDIYQYKPEEFTELRDRLFEIKDQVEGKKKTIAIEDEKAKAGAPVVYKDGEITIRKILNKDASCKYGKGTKWCTTMKDKGYFEDYVAHNTVFYYIEDAGALEQSNRHKIAFVVQRDINNDPKILTMYDAADNVILNENLPLDNAEIIDVNGKSLMNKQASLSKIPFAYHYAPILLEDAAMEPKGLVVKVREGISTPQEIDTVIGYLESNQDNSEIANSYFDILANPKGVEKLDPKQLARIQEVFVKNFDKVDMDRVSWFAQSLPKGWLEKFVSHKYFKGFSEEGSYYKKYRQTDIANAMERVVKIAMADTYDGLFRDTVENEGQNFITNFISNAIGDNRDLYYTSYLRNMSPRYSKAYPMITSTLTYPELKQYMFGEGVSERDKLQGLAKVMEREEDQGLTEHANYLFNSFLEDRKLGDSIANVKSLVLTYFSMTSMGNVPDAGDIRRKLNILNNYSKIHTSIARDMLNLNVFKNASSMAVLDYEGITALSQLMNKYYITTGEVPGQIDSVLFPKASPIQRKNMQEVIAYTGLVGNELSKAPGFKETVKMMESPEFQKGQLIKVDDFGRKITPDFNDVRESSPESYTTSISGPIEEKMIIGTKIPASLLGKKADFYYLENDPSQLKMSESKSAMEHMETKARQSGSEYIVLKGINGKSSEFYKDNGYTLSGNNSAYKKVEQKEIDIVWEGDKPVVVGEGVPTVQEVQNDMFNFKDYFDLTPTEPPRVKPQPVDKNASLPGQEQLFEGLLPTKEEIMRNKLQAELDARRKPQQPVDLAMEQKDFIGPEQTELPLQDAPSVPSYPGTPAGAKNTVVKNIEPEMTIPVETAEIYQKSNISLALQNDGVVMSGKLYIKSPLDVADLLVKIRNSDVERLQMVYLKGGKIIATEVHSIGGIDRSPVYYDSVAKKAVMLGADSVLDAHNHPSSVLKPSPADHVMAKNLEKALKVVGVKKLNTLITNDGLLEMELIPSMNRYKTTIITEKMEYSKEKMYEIPMYRIKQIREEGLKTARQIDTAVAMYMYRDIYNNVNNFGDKLLVTFTNTQNKVISIVAYKNDMSSVNEILKYALKVNSNNLFTALKGSSVQSMPMIMKLVEEGDNLNIRLQDHITVGEGAGQYNALTEHDQLGQIRRINEANQIPTIDVIRKNLFGGVQEETESLYTPFEENTMARVARNKILGDIHALKAYKNISDEVYKDIVLDVTGMESLKTVDDTTELAEVLKTLKEHIALPDETRNLIAKIKREALDVGDIYRFKGRKSDAKFKRRIKTLFGVEKNVNNLTIEELKKLSFDLKKQTKAPIGLSQFALPPYSAMKNNDLVRARNTLKELNAKLLKKQITPEQAKEMAKDMLPLEGNNLAAFKEFGTYSAIGKPLEQAGVMFREYVNNKLFEYQKLLKNVKQTKELGEKLFDAGDFGDDLFTELKLNEAELEVLRFARRTFNELADMMGLEKRRSNYMPHVLEDFWREVLKSGTPIPDEIAGIMEFSVPKEIYAGFMQERKGFPFFKRSFFEVFPAYIRMAARKAAYDKVMPMVNTQIALIRDPSVKKFTRTFVQENILNRSPNIDRLITNSIKPLEKLFGEKTLKIDPKYAAYLKEHKMDVPSEIKVPRVNLTPNKLHQWVGNLKLINYLSTIGLNVGTAALNLTQPSIMGAFKLNEPFIRRTWTMFRAHAEAVVILAKMAKNPKYTLALEKNDLMQKSDSFLELQHSGKSKVAKVMGGLSSASFAMMKITEIINRVVSGRMGAIHKQYMAKKGEITIEELNKLINLDDKSKIMKLDRDFAVESNFLFGPEQTPNIFINAIGKALYHLNSFTIKYAAELYLTLQKANVGKQIRLFNKLTAEGKIKNEEQFIRFLNGMAPEKRSQFIYWLIFSTGLGLLIFSDPLMFTSKGVMPGQNPVIAGLKDLAEGILLWDIPKMKRATNTLIPFRSAVKRIQRVEQEGPYGLISRAKPLKAPKKKSKLPFDDMTVQSEEFTPDQLEDIK